MEKALPEGGASVTQGSGVKNDGPVLSGLKPETILEAAKRIPSKECRAPAAVSGAVSEAHRALMVMVVEKVLSAKSGLNEAFMSLLKGFEVCDVILPMKFY